MNKFKTSFQLYFLIIRNKFLLVKWQVVQVGAGNSRKGLGPGPDFAN